MNSVQIQKTRATIEAIDTAIQTLTAIDPDYNLGTIRQLEAARVEHVVSLPRYIRKDEKI